MSWVPSGQLQVPEFCTFQLTRKPANGPSSVPADRTALPTICASNVHGKSVGSIAVEVGIGDRPQAAAATARTTIPAIDNKRFVCILSS
jgi:hypothetical protein